MSIVRMLRYCEWSNAEERVVRDLLELPVGSDDLFMRKLVNATVLRNRLFEHSSHESEEGRLHTIYVKPFEGRELEKYGPQIEPPLSEHCDTAPAPEAEFLHWDGRRFRRGEPAAAPEGPLEIARLLLDHYVVANGRTHETIYSVFDADRNKVVFYMKEDIVR